MSDDGSNASQRPQQTVDPVQELLQGSNGTPGQPLTADQRNERREALLKRQREAREKAQQISQDARANAAANGTNTSTMPAPAPAPAPAIVNDSAAITISPVPSAVATVTAPSVAAVLDTPIRENMVQQAVSFLSSPSVQNAEEAKKIQFLEKKGLTSKEIELARARVTGTASVPAVGTPAQQPSQQQQPYQVQAGPASGGAIPPPVPPRNYVPIQPYAQQPIYIPQPAQQQVMIDPNAFKKKLLIAMLVSGGVTVLTSIIVQKLIYPMVRGITGARQTLAISQKELLGKLKEKLTGYREYLMSLHLGSNRTPIKQIKDDAAKDTKTTVEDEDEDEEDKKSTVVTTTAAKDRNLHLSTVKQLDAFQTKLESHAESLNFEQLKATRAMTQDLAEYITKETYALSTSIAYPTSRYYGYNTAGAAASGKGGLADPTTPESALKSEIRSLKGLLLNWRNFPVAKEVSASAGQVNGVSGLPTLVQQQ
ncbi:hypothetical protein BGX28_004857 [Mortierella sp. GBA30]|nr:hypothetical protein BGX28_004857 [Mortierella sp. GBA30]